MFDECSRCYPDLANSDKTRSACMTCCDNPYKTEEEEYEDDFDYDVSHQKAMEERGLI